MNSVLKKMVLQTPSQYLDYVNGILLWLRREDPDIKRVIQDRWNKEAVLIDRVHHWPGRPCAEDIEIFRQLLDSIRPQKILILGATPELRDLSQKIIEEPISLADLSLVMLKETSRYLRSALITRERWYFANWLSLPFNDNLFDVVLADLAVKQVVPDKRRILLSEIFRVLAPNGYLLTRSHYINPRWRQTALEQITEGIKGEQMTVEEIKMTLRYRLYDRWVDPKTETFLIPSVEQDEQSLMNSRNPFLDFNTFDISAWVKEMISKIKLGEERVGQERALIGRLQRWAPTGEDVLTLAKPFFRLVATKYGTRGEDHIFTPIELFQKI